MEKSEPKGTILVSGSKNLNGTVPKAISSQSINIYGWVIDRTAADRYEFREQYILPQEKQTKSIFFFGIDTKVDSNQSAGMYPVSQILLKR